MVRTWLLMRENSLADAGWFQALLTLGAKRKLSGVGPLQMQKG